MLKALLKVQWAIFVSIFTGSARSKKKQSAGKAIGFALLMVYAFGALMFLFFHVFDTIAAPFSALGLDWFYFTMMWLIAFALMFIGSVFTAKAQLFEAKDNERLLAMPIPPEMILLSRMVVLYLLNLALGLLVLLPAVLVWGFGNMSAAGILAFVLEALLLPLLAIAVSSLFAWLIVLITNRLPKKNLVTMILYVVFIGAYMVFCARMNEYILQLAGLGEQLAESLGGVAPIYWLGAAPAGSAPAILGVLADCLIPFAVLYMLLSRSFIRMMTMKRSEKKIVYKQEAMEVVVPKKALLNREFKHLLSCPTWMLNGGFGAIFSVVGTVVLLIKSRDISELFSLLGLPQGSVAVVLLLIVMALIGLAPFSNCAVSLEGKSLWQIRSMPVESWNVLEAKLKMTEWVNLVPVCIFVAVAVILTGMDSDLFIPLLLGSVIFTRLIVKIGLVEDLRHGKLDWVSEAQAVKQSMSVLLTMAISFGLTAAVGLLWFLLLSSRIEGVWYLCGVLVVFVLADRWLGSWLKTKGVKLFEELG